MTHYILTPEEKAKAYAHNETLSAEMRHYASGEVISGTAYYLNQLPKHEVGKKRFSLLQPEGQWQDYRAESLEVTVGGLHGYVLLPMDKYSKDVKVVFRGTYDFDSLMRDFEKHGPGAWSIEVEKESLIAQINQAICKQYGENPKDIHLTIEGHSLGGSDAENFAVFALENIANQAELSYVNQMSLYTYNSPGVPKERNEMSLRDIALIKQHNPNFKVDVHFGKSEHDLIQQLGESHIFKGADPSLVEMDILEVDKGHVIDLPEDEYTPSYYYKLIKELFKRAVDSHSLSHFFTPDEKGFITDAPFGYKFLTNLNPEDLAEIEQELNDKAINLLYTYKYLIDMIYAIQGWFGKKLTSENLVELGSGKLIDLNSLMITLKSFFPTGFFFGQNQARPMQQTCAIEALRAQQDLACRFSDIRLSQLRG